MFNLLPQEYQHNLKKEYSRRLITLVLIAFFCIGLAGVLTLFPSYLLSLQKEKEISVEDINIEKTLRADVVDLNKQIKSIKEDTALVLGREAQNQIYLLLAQILEKKSSGIIIKSLSYKKQNDDPVSVAVAGVANTRDGLLSFTKELETLEVFESVNIPVSNFAKDRNIEFSLDLIKNKKQ